MNKQKILNIIGAVWLFINLAPFLYGSFFYAFLESKFPNGAILPFTVIALIVLIIMAICSYIFSKRVLSFAVIFSVAVFIQPLLQWEFVQDYLNSHQLIVQFLSYAFLFLCLYWLAGHRDK